VDELKKKKDGSGKRKWNKIFGQQKEYQNTPPFVS